MVDMQRYNPTHGFGRLARRLSPLDTLTTYYEPMKANVDITPTTYQITLLYLL